MSNQRVLLSDLGHFTIASILALPQDEVELRGSFSHLRGVRSGRGWLYIWSSDAILGDLAELDPESKTARFTSVNPRVELQPGQSFPWLDGYWDPWHVAMVLGPETSFKRVAFQPQAAVSFRQPSVPGHTVLAPEGQALPADAQEVRVLDQGWDHEHCKLCMQTIGVGGMADGYVNPENRWLCTDCFEKFVVRHDLSFLLDI